MPTKYTGIPAYEIPKTKQELINELILTSRINVANYTKIQNLLKELITESYLTGVDFGLTCE
jgi:hypothetical protein